MLMGGIEDDICDGRAEVKVDPAGLKELSDWYNYRLMAIVIAVIEWTNVV